MFLSATGVFSLGTFYLLISGVDAIMASGKFSCRVRYGSAIGLALLTLSFEVWLFVA